MGKKKGASGSDSKVKLEASVSMVPFADITPYARNVKKHTAASIAALAKEIEANGFDVPLVLDEEFVILKGHKRHLAAKLLGLSDIPCIVRSDLTKTQKQKIRIADNRLNDKDWDVENLKDEIDEIMREDDDFESGDIGFEDEEIDDLFGDDDADDDEPKPERVKKEKRTIESHRTTTVEKETPLDKDGNELKPKAGSKEYKAEEFEKFDHICPKCKFEFNDKN